MTELSDNGEFETRIAQRVRHLLDRDRATADKLERLKRTAAGQAGLNANTDLPGNPARTQAYSVPVLITDSHDGFVVGVRMMMTDDGELAPDPVFASKPIRITVPPNTESPAVGSYVTSKFVNKTKRWAVSESGRIAPGGYVLEGSGAGTSSYPAEILGAIGPNTEVSTVNGEISNLIIDQEDVEDEILYDHYYVLYPGSGQESLADATAITSVQQLQIAEGSIIPAGTKTIIHRGRGQNFTMQVPVWM